MSILKAGWTTWHPQTSRDREAVLLELEEVLTSAHFCNSKRYPALLRYVVERSLAGEASQLKERTLGIDVFHRPPDYDTHSDTVVRYTAGEVRKRLLLYYHERESQLQISLPAGSYVPEFLCLVEEDAPASSLHKDPEPEPTPAPGWSAEVSEPHWPQVSAELLPGTPLVHSTQARRAWPWLVLVIAIAIFAVVGWNQWTIRRQTALDQFWAPMLHQARPALICSGGTVFAANYSGTRTAGRDTDYPFVSMQVASAIASIAGQLERSGATIQMASAPVTPLTDLRERPVVLIGGYNNEWTLRLLAPLRFSFGAEPSPEIEDQLHPGSVWKRDRSLPYASADDYAVVARFHDATTGSLIVVAAGLGRNGTEAAAQFITNPYYMSLLRDTLKEKLGSKNIEAVLKIKVIDGKTGAPTIEAVTSW